MERLRDLEESRLLARLFPLYDTAVPRPWGSVPVGPGDDAAVLAIGSRLQVLTTDHLRAFCNDPRLMARLTAIHAPGHDWAMGAARWVAVAQVTWAPRGPGRRSA